MRFVCPDSEPQYEQILSTCGDVAERAGHELEWFPAPTPRPSDWDARARGADGLLLVWSLPSGVLTRCPSVRVVSFLGTGVEDYIDMEEARSLDVSVCNVPSYAANAVAEHAFALVLAVARRIAAGDRLVRAGEWRQDEGVELRGKRLGVVGAGPIGARAIEIGKGLGMDVVAWTRSPSPERAARLGVRFASLEELFRSSDVVTLHLAHRAETERIVDRRLLELMPEQAILVNTARAQLVDEGALLELVTAGSIRGAGLDVFEHEPPPAGGLRQCDRVVLSPHVGYRTPEATAALFLEGVQNLLAFARGQSRNHVPEVHPPLREAT